MPRKKQPAAEATAQATESAATAVAEPPSSTEDRGPDNPNAKNWGPPYKVIFSSTANGFEMGENRRYKQRVFKFTDKPSEEVLAALKENGFVYRGAEKAWTIPANPDTRKLSEELAQKFAGQGEARGR